MAKRRCFSIDFFESEKFLNLTNEAKALYLGLLLHSDDEGVVINTSTVMRMMGAKYCDLEEISDAGLLLEVSGTYIIKHWLVHNKVQPSRLVKSLYQEELSKLCVNQRDEYVLKEDFV